MNGPREHKTNDFDDGDMSFDPAFNVDFEDDVEERVAAGRHSLAAWQQIDRRAEKAWLRDQMDDWDDWDESDDWNN